MVKASAGYKVGYPEKDIPIFCDAKINSNVIDYISLNGSYYEEDILRQCQRFIPSGGIVVDVGANIGNHAVFFAKKCGATVFAFEPNPALIDGLRKTVTENRLEKQIFIEPLFVSNEASNSLQIPEDDVGSARRVEDVGMQYGSVVHVDSVRLDEYQPLSGRRISLIKIDAEGHEASIISSANSIIEQQQPTLVVEVGSHQEYIEKVAFLARFNYVLVGEGGRTRTALFVHQSKIGLDDLAKNSTDSLVSIERLRYDFVSGLNRLARNNVQSQEHLDERLSDIERRIEALQLVLSGLTDVLIEKIVDNEAKSYSYSNFRKLVFGVSRKIKNRLRRIIS